LATITIAGQLVHEALDLPWEFSDPVETLWDELMASTPEARPAQRALHYAANWATANENRFHRTTPNSQPSNGWAGKFIGPSDGTGIENVSHGGWRSIGFLDFQLRQLLADGGFTDFEAIVRAWYDNGWLQTTSQRRKLRTRIGANNVYVIAITREAIDEATELNSEHAA
jgi:hypothetical protein